MKIVWSLRKDAVKKFASKTKSKTRGMLHQVLLLLIGLAQICFLL